MRAGWYLAIADFLFCYWEVIKFKSTPAKCDSLLILGAAAGTTRGQSGCWDVEFASLLMAPRLGGGACHSLLSPPNLPCASPS